MDTLTLARMQFALSIGFHFIFPPISIGLGWFLTQVEWLGWRRNDPRYVAIGKYFGKMFALTFALGVATGIVMEFQFGMNWSRYSEFVGDIFGAPLAAEGVFAFFLESSFLGLYLFGRGKVSKGVHWFSSFMVALGATISAFWILVANSWQQTPAGYELVAKMPGGEIIRRSAAEGVESLPAGAQLIKAELVDFWAAIFNPSMMLRFCHQINACVIVGAFFVAGISAYLILRKPNCEIAKKSMKLAIICGLISTIIAAAVTGDLHAKNIAHWQPTKLAAMEGIMETQKGAPVVIIGIPSEEGVTSILEIPGLLSFLAYSDFDAEVRGLNEVPKEDRPPIVITFTAFHIMVGLGSFFIILMCWSAFLLMRGSLWNSRYTLKLLIICIPLPVLANQVGWITTEVGRQPWVVYGLLRTADAHSTTVVAGEVLFSLILFASIYALLGVLYLFLLIRKIKAGPDENIMTLEGVA
ncbi:MAG: cytochrome ubiquinol oxidase subunit I [Planctomycetes bacterium]|nr:cytochrome ubiquinol oxidase subunit I [Planctomycetota bacterium]